MGTSVAVPSAAELVLFVDASEVGMRGTLEDGTEVFPGDSAWEDRTSTEYDETGEEWDWFLGNLRDEICSWYPSLRPHSKPKWFRDFTVLADNDMAAVLVAEYGGILSVSLVPASEAGVTSWAPLPFQVRWIDNVRKGFTRRMHRMFGAQLLCRDGFMSNGCGVFRSFGEWKESET